MDPLLAQVLLTDGAVQVIIGMLILIGESERSQVVQHMGWQPLGLICNQSLLPSFMTLASCL